MPSALATVLLSQRDFFPGATFGADFRAGRYKLGRRQYRHPSAIPGWSFTRASTGYAETSGGVLVPFASGEPRITDKGLLVEEQRTNLVTRSQELDYWTKTGTTVSSDATTAPDGTQTADKVVEVSAAATPRVGFGGATTVIGTVYTFSVFAKAAERSQIRIVQEGSGLFAAYYNLANGTVVSVGASATASIQALGSGWYRCVLTWTAAATNPSSYVATAEAGSVVASGDPTKGVFLWGMQLEAGSFATSYIPTTTASATRAADAPVLSISQTVPLTAVVSAMPTAVSTAGSAIYMLLDDVSASNRVRLYNDVSLPNARMLVTVGGATQVSMANTAVVAGSRLKMAARAEVNNAGLSVNGGAVITDVSCTMPTPTRLIAADANAYIERWVVYPYAMTDAQLQAVTT